MRRNAVRLIAAKELLDTLRDRRTLFVALVLPLLLYPALLLGLTQIIGATQRNLGAEHQRVLVDLDGVDELANFLRDENIEPVPVAEVDAEVADAIRNDVADLGGDQTDAARGRLRNALSTQELAGAVLGGEDFAQRLGADRQAEATLLFDSTDESSIMARRKVARGLATYQAARREQLREKYPDQADRFAFAQSPIHETTVEVASSAQKGAYSFAPLLGMLIVIMALTGAFYPAVDLVAGEKERGTLETLLVAPVTRTEIVLGKFLAVWVIAVTTALLNLVVMGLTFSRLSGMLGTSRIAFSVPVDAALIVSLILIPTAALFSAIALALSSFATSYKEGQHYMSPLFLVATPLAMVGLLPNVEIGYSLALVPVANIVLLVKGMLLGTGGVGPAVVAFAAMVFYALVALRVAVGLFQRESVLFRTGAGRGFDARSLKASRKGMPREWQGMLLFFIVLAMMFYLSSDVKTTRQAVGALLKAQLLAVFLPTLLIALLAKINLRETFSIRAPRVVHLPLVVIAAIGTLTALLFMQAHLLPQRDAQGFEKVVGLIQALPRWKLLILLAVLPPICEELLCRGFLLSSLRARFGWKGAVAVSAALFGVLHLDLYRFPATAIAGLMLGYICVRTRSVINSIVFHVVYNGIIAYIVATPSLAESLETPPAWAAGLGVLAAAGALLGIHRTSERV